MCLYLEAASQLFLVQTELKRFPDKRKRNDDLLTKVNTSIRPGGKSLSTLLDVFRRGISLSERSLFSISSQFLSLSLNNILEKREHCSIRIHTHPCFQQKKESSHFREVHSFITFASSRPKILNADLMSGSIMT